MENTKDAERQDIPFSQAARDDADWYRRVSSHIAYMEKPA